MKESCSSCYYYSAQNGQPSGTCSELSRYSLQYAVNVGCEGMFICAHDFWCRLYSPGQKEKKEGSDKASVSGIGEAGFYYVKVYKQVEPPPEHYKIIGARFFSINKKTKYAYFYKALHVYLAYRFICKDSESEGLLFLRRFDEKMRQDQSPNEMQIYNSHLDRISNIDLATDGVVEDPLFAITIDVVTEMMGEADENASMTLYSHFNTLRKSIPTLIAKSLK